jgi:hypothetical protein
VFAFAVKERCILVTENFADYSAILERCLARDEPSIPIVFVCKSALPRGGALAVHLARHLAQWATLHPEPYAGLHWP